jgi:hypothetical protein
VTDPDDPDETPPSQRETPLPDEPAPSLPPTPTQWRGILAALLGKWPGKR